MIEKRILIIFLAIAFSSSMNGQTTCKELYVKANSYFNAGKYDDAKQYYNRVISCGDVFYLRDCENKINLIEEATYKAKSSAPFGLSKENVLIPYQGGDAVVTVNGGGSWKVYVNCDWCTVRKSGSQIIITSAENPGLSDRETEIRVMNGTQYRTIHVKNNGAPEIIRSSVANVMFPSDGETNTVDIFSNTEWKIAEAPSWIKIIRDSSKINMTASVNKDSHARESDVRIQTRSNAVIVINIYQGAGKEQLSFSKNELHFGPQGGDEYIKIYTDAESWKFGDFPHWCQLTRIAEDSLKIHCTPNTPTNEIREASVNITTGLQTLGVNIFQEARPVVAALPEYGIGGRKVSVGFYAGYIYPTISASAGGSFTASAVNYAMCNRSENPSWKSSGGFSAGVYADIRLYRNLFMSAGLDFVHYTFSNEYIHDGERKIIVASPDYYQKGVIYDKYQEDYSFNTIELPVLLSWRFPLTKISHIQLNAGPVLTYGITARLKLSGNSDGENLTAFKIIGNQHTDEPDYSVTPQPHHIKASGELDMYSDRVTYTQTYVEFNNSVVDKSKHFESAPLKRLNFGARVGVAYEYSGFNVGLDYSMQLTNCADKRFWEGPRWPIFDQNGSSAMSGYRQHNHYLQIRVGYTFRYKK